MNDSKKPPGKKMNFDGYITLLKNEKGLSNYVELDKHKELAYMKGGKYRFTEIISSIPCSSTPVKILDVGATPFTFFIKELYPHYEVSTLDLTSHMESRCKTKGIQFKKCNLNEEPIPFEDNYFDLVVFTEVLEHLFVPPSDILRELRRIMRVGGKLIFSVPNIATLYHRIKLLWGISPLYNPDIQMEKGGTHGYGHIREYTMKEITSRLKACNFTISSKKFLQYSPLSSFKRLNRGITFSLLRFFYLIITLLVPSFRFTIHIECRR